MLKNEVQFCLDIIGQAKISSQLFFRPQPHTAVMLEVLSMQQRRIFCSCNAQPFCRMPNFARPVPSKTHSRFAHDSECMMRKPTIPVSLVFFQSGPTDDVQPNFATPGRGRGSDLFRGHANALCVAVERTHLQDTAEDIILRVGTIKRPTNCGS
jgi:hypothetical protein